MNESSIIDKGDPDEASSREASAIVELLLKDEPHRVVLIGPSAKILEEALSSRCECQHFDTIESCAAASLDDRNAAVALLWFCSDEPEADSELGMTCRLFPRRVLVRVPGQQPVMPASRFFAFGFQRVELPELPVDETAASVYEYRLADYKQPPDWLNARYWANPQRFSVLEPDYDDAGEAQSDDNIAGDEDDYEPEEDEYE